MVSVPSAAERNVARSVDPASGIGVQGFDPNVRKLPVLWVLQRPLAIRGLVCWSGCNRRAAEHLNGLPPQQHAQRNVGLVSTAPPADCGTSARYPSMAAWAVGGASSHVTGKQTKIANHRSTGSAMPNVRQPHAGSLQPVIPLFMGGSIFSVFQHCLAESTNGTLVVVHP